MYCFVCFSKNVLHGCLKWNYILHILVCTAFSSICQKSLCLHFVEEVWEILCALAHLSKVSTLLIDQLWVPTVLPWLLCLCNTQSWKKKKHIQVIKDTCYYFSGKYNSKQKTWIVLMPLWEKRFKTWSLLICLEGAKHSNFHLWNQVSILYFETQ